MLEIDSEVQNLYFLIVIRYTADLLMELYQNRMLNKLFGTRCKLKGYQFVTRIS